MPLGAGFWFDRKVGTYLRIEEHATNALADPNRYGIEAWVRDFRRRHRNAQPSPVEDRDAVVIAVAKQGFIRIRHYKDRLGWQFYGDPLEAVIELRRYIEKHEVGDLTIVTFTDFRQSKTTEAEAGRFRRGANRRILVAPRQWEEDQRPRARLVRGGEPQAVRRDQAAGRRRARRPAP